MPKDYGEIKEELEKLKTEANSLRSHLQVYGILKAKYETLASGQKRRGRYKIGVDSDLADACLSMLGY